MKKLLILSGLSVLGLSNADTVCGTTAGPRRFRESTIKVEEDICAEAYDRRRTIPLSELKANSYAGVCLTLLNEKDSEAALSVLSETRKTLTNATLDGPNLNSEQRELLNLESEKSRKIRVFLCAIDDARLSLLIDVVKNTPSLQSFCFTEDHALEISAKGVLKLFRALVESPILVSGSIGARNNSFRVIRRYLVSLGGRRMDRQRCLRVYAKSFSKFMLEEYRKSDERVKRKQAYLNAEIDAAEHMIDTISGYQEALIKLKFLTLKVIEQDVADLRDLENFWEPVDAYLQKTRLNIKERLRQFKIEKRDLMYKLGGEISWHSARWREFRDGMYSVHRTLKYKIEDLQRKQQEDVKSRKAAPEVQIDTRLMKSDKEIVEILKQGLEVFAKKSEKLEAFAKKSERTDTNDLIVSVTKALNTEMYNQCKIIQDYVCAECDKLEEMINKTASDMNGKLWDFFLPVEEVLQKKIDAVQEEVFAIQRKEASEAQKEALAAAQRKEKEYRQQMEELDGYRKDVRARLSEWSNLSIEVIDKIKEKALPRIINFQGYLENTICDYQIRWVK